MEIFDRVCCKDHEEWLKLRGHGVGGSDCSAVIGLNPYKTNLQLWQEKVGLREQPKIENEHTKYGQACEDALRTIFQADFVGKLCVRHKDNEILVRKDKSWLRASLDGEIEVLEDCTIVSFHYANADKSETDFILNLKKGMRGILEIKTADILSSMHKEKWGEEIPDNYYCQTIHYLNVTGYEFAIICPQLTRNIKGVKTHETRLYGYMREDREDDLRLLEEAVDNFWLNNVQKRIEPPLQINI